MAQMTSTRQVNPRLGAYFGIFASLFTALFVLALIFAELGANEVILRFAILLGPLVLYAALGVGTMTARPSDFFAAGRRVPAVYNGSVIALAALGGVSVIVFPGLFYAHGYDVWSLALGGALGLVLMGVLVAPYYRKFGAYTVAGFLGRRFRSRSLRIASAAILAIPLFLLLIGELSIGVWAARQLTGSNVRWMLFAFVATAAVVLLLGGMRAATWAGAAQAIAAVIALVVCAGTAGIMYTNLPVAQLSVGPLLRDVTAIEATLGIAARPAGTLEARFAGDGLVALASPMVEPFTTLGPAAFVAALLAMAFGIAAAPWLLARCGTAVGVHAARKSLSWAVFFYGLIMITASTVAIMMRDGLLSSLGERSAATIPAWYTLSAKAGLTGELAPSDAFTLATATVHRDGVLFLLPQASGLPEILTYLAYAGAFAAVLVAAIATAQALATMIAEDIVGGLLWEPPAEPVRMAVARIALFGVLVTATVAVQLTSTDPFALFLTAVSLSAATAFPVVMVAIWHKRAPSMSVMTGLCVGLVTALGTMIVSTLFALGVFPPFAGLAGMLAGFLSIFATGRMFKRPVRPSLEYVRDMRIPGGETIYDREMRLLRMKRDAGR
ncbi:MAG: cation acetate symporter [Hyphomicrobiaceae bacterium]